MRCYACGRDAKYKAYFSFSGKTTMRFVCEEDEKSALSDGARIENIVEIGVSK
jgi:hypothetical protein